MLPLAPPPVQQPKSKKAQTIPEEEEDEQILKQYEKYRQRHPVTADPEDEQSDDENDLDEAWLRQRQQQQQNVPSASKLIAQGVMNTLFMLDRVKNFVTAQDIYQQKVEQGVAVPAPFEVHRQQSRAPPPTTFSSMFVQEPRFRMNPS